MHYVVLNDVFWYGSSYLGYLDQGQLDWLAADLALVQAGRTVIVALHIPVQSSQPKRTGRNATKIIQQAARSKERFKWLTPPSSMGALTIADIRPAKDAQEHARLVRQWAKSAWSAWSEHHPAFRTWLAESWRLQSGRG